MSWLQGTVGSQELLAAGCANGSFKLISKGTRVEKNIPDAHSGAVIFFITVDYLYQVEL